MIISFIGLGEVGSAFSQELAKAGAVVRGYDLRYLDPLEKDKFIPCAEAGVKLVDSPQVLVEGSDIIIAVTSCAHAVATAAMCKPFLQPKQRYIELNSTVPEIVNQVRTLLGEGCNLIDGATLLSPSQFGIATPVVMSGEYAKQTIDELNSFGMKIRYLGNQVGQASAYKVIRSIFTKGLEAVLVESMTAARKYGLEDEIFQTIVDFVSGEDINATLALMIRTNVIHAKRRGDEISEVVSMLKKAGLENTMSEAATQKLYWLASLGLKEKFNGEKATSMYEAIDAMLEFQNSN